MEQKRLQLDRVSERLCSAQVRSVDRKKQQFIGLTAKLDAMSPLKVLTRGYAMTQTPDGQVVRSVSQTPVGSKLMISLSDGKISATVDDVKENVR